MIIFFSCGLLNLLTTLLPLIFVAVIEKNLWIFGINVKPTMFINTPCNMSSDFVGIYADIRLILALDLLHPG